MLKTLPILAFLLFVGSHCLGQRKFLMLQMKNENKNASYQTGDKISFRMKDHKRKITGTILDLKDSIIVFKGFEVKVSEISSLYIDEKTKWWLRYKVEQLCLLAGAGYLLLDTINSGELDENTLIISGSLISVGILAKIFIGNRIKIKGRTKLRIVVL